MKKRKNIEPAFKTVIMIQGLKIGLTSMAAIARYLGYKTERMFTNRMRLRSFDLAELNQIFEKLYFTDEDILKFFDRNPELRRSAS